MLTQSTAIQDRVEGNEAQECLGGETDKLVMTSVFIAAGLVGAWTVARIGSAMYTAGGPVALFQAWLML